MTLTLDAQAVLANALFIPVICILFIMLCWSLLELGGFARECVERRRRRRNWTLFSERLVAAGKTDAAGEDKRFLHRSDYPGFVAVFAARGARIASDPAHIGKLAADIEIEAAHGQLRMNLGIRLGPALGLIGTLIPMGPALLGLSTGDVGRIAENLAVAFSTTILGLGVRAVCYFISIGTRHWYAKDLADIDYVCHFLCQEKDSAFHEDNQNRQSATEKQPRL